MVMHVKGSRIIYMKIERMKASFLLIDSTYPINTRNDKVLGSLREMFPDSAVNVVTWNRDQRPQREDWVPTHLYHRPSPYGKSIKKLKNMVGYYRFVKKLNESLKPSIIIASHWDMLIIGALMKKDSQVLIYENLDIPKSSNKIVLTILQWIEKTALRKTDIAIFASRFYEPLYPQTNFDKIVVENKPIDIRSHVRPLREESTDLIVSYIGGVRYVSILKNLVDAVKKVSGVRLEVHGEGYQLEELIAYAARNEKITFTGRYEYQTIGRLYDSADVVWAVYPNDDHNVKYAISNKFHESLQYGVPCIYAWQTKLGDMVCQSKIGFTVNPYSSDDIARLLEYLRDNRSTLAQAVEHNREFLSKELSWREEIAPLVSMIQARMCKKRVVERISNN